MDIWEVSFSGGVMILAVILLRALALDRLPKGTFLALWLVAAARLLLPVSIPSPLSVYSLAEQIPVWQEMAEEAAQAVPAGAPGSPAAVADPALPQASDKPQAPDELRASPALPQPPEGGIPLWEAVRLAGTAMCGAFFLAAYLRCRRTYRGALPVEAMPADWTARGRLRRRVELRQSDRVAAPLTYGVLRPVILLPRNMDWSDGERLVYVLEHELVHIRRFDGLTKLALAAAACVHWFNPLAWVMLVLANRDIELRCDEAVVNRFGPNRRSAYAMALIAMEEQKSGLGPFASAFSKNAIEERIRAIMRMKKRSLAAVLAAIALVCCVSVAFATSAAERRARPVPRVADGVFTRAELEELAALWLDGWEEMTVADYQQALWPQNDTPAHHDLLDRYGQNQVTVGYYNDPAADEEANAFNDYFRYVFEPLTGEHWARQFFAGAEGARDQTDHAVFLEYSYSLEVLDRDKLTAGAYRQVHRDIEEGIQAILRDPAARDLTEGTQAYEAAFTQLSARLSTDSLSVTVEGGLLVQSFGSGNEEDLDAALHRQSSEESAAQWDQVLSPYVPFGLTYTFDDPDLDGNGLTMTYQGREVRGIMDPQEGVWITEHTGPGFGEDAVELYAVYVNGQLAGLRLAAPEEQAAFDESRRKNGQLRPGADTLPAGGETREFPRATQEDYDALMTLRTEGYELSSLEDFNRQLLDWGNRHGDAWDRINCDVIWSDCGVQLTEEERTFASLTCWQSGTENGQMIRAIYTGGPEADPGFSANLPERQAAEGDIVLAWCNLYYDISYHIPDKTAVTVTERDRCVGGMWEEIARFWQETDMEALLEMTEADVVELFNRWGRENSTSGLRFNTVTADNIHFESKDERGRN